MIKLTVWRFLQINEEIPVKHLPSSEPDPHVVRIGWSLNHCSTQLGENICGGINKPQKDILTFDMLFMNYP